MLIHATSSRACAPPWAKPAWMGRPSLAVMYIQWATSMLRMFTRHLVVRASSFALASDGSRIDTSSAMMAMTTSSSISVKPCRGRRKVLRFRLR